MKSIYKEINAWSKRKGHLRLRKIIKKALHLVITFILGIVLATIYHAFVTNDKVKQAAESICNNFGKDAEECKSNIDDLLNESDNEVDNNININGGE